MAAEKLGIDADKLNLVVVWREAPIFSRARTRGAGVDRGVDAGARKASATKSTAEVSAEFSEKELAYLSTAIAAINVWNRFGAPYRCGAAGAAEAAAGQAS